MAEIVRLETKQLSFDEMLEEFWRAYPSRTKKLWVKRALGKALHEDSFENILAGVEKYKLSEKVMSGFILDPQNWLSAGCWMDEAPPPKPVKHEWDTEDDYQVKLKIWAAKL